MYAQVCTRPEISFVVGMMGRYQSDPGLDHWRAAKKLMRYLQGTKNYMFMYRRTSNLEVISYSASDLAGCVDSCKSTSGYIFMMVGGVVSWRSAKQTLIATSTMKPSSSPVLRLIYMVYGLRVSFLGLELWILSLSHWEYIATIQLLFLWLRTIKVGVEINTSKISI